jgi:hypothetical protein
MKDIARDAVFAFMSVLKIFFNSLARGAKEAI